MEENNEWRENNEAFKRNRRRKVITIAAVVSAAAVLILLIVMYALDADKRAYTAGLDGYYKTLNEGSAEAAKFHDQEVTQGGRAFLDGAGYASVNDWYRAIQRYEIEQLSGKYGEGFTVQYRIISSEKLTEEELEELHSKSVATVGYVRAYRLTVKEHFVGDKDDGYEEQTIIAIKNDEDGWQYDIQRWTQYARNREV
ncbi:hypothetical protein SAMN02910447_00853 [Ruminococcus sp. YE71]|uniref:hypothetical protein n=1 Tax=unclassified Ruminococcus TaxID=2608920 RepID=UPI00088DF2E9|nr:MULTISPECIES: hypothetical protein [unclassified Ruminococcus]SDA14501.1 hypothetical protein SAMN02910446_00852 [Ruminococcus sp. YE78]SFW21123.1 hypothetical protein SAMN02910447_00853 [Ruminococcus sp. YE71]